MGKTVGLVFDQEQAAVHTCEVCGAEFTSKKKLAEHLKAHDGAASPEAGGKE